MGLFKKKDGSPSLLGKIVGTASKVSGTIGQVAGTLTGIAPLAKVGEKLAENGSKMATGSRVDVSSITDVAQSIPVVSNAVDKAQAWVQAQTGGIVDIKDYLPQAGESNQELVARYSAAAGAAIAGANNAITSKPYVTNPSQALQIGFTKETLYKWLFIAGAALGSLLLIFKLLKRK